ncbi:HNH endonuclease [Paenibacillus polymyxa]|uniref:HNH endonuclease n=1 Tax=Paenibacillus polymyxa TaxID=1406 RepID=UPI002AB3B08E|nr:HNH endonuclease [Paenibacillus polymyxa]MDY8021161.1 HNH endonuclease [Paenibacillus polymyxa]
MKQCSICLKIKTSDGFYYQKKNTKKKGESIYYHPECKECSKQRAMAWQKDNPEKFTVNRKRYDRTENRKKLHYEYNRVRIENGKHREYIKNSPQKVRQYRKNHRIHEITEEQWISCKNYFSNEYNEWECAYCGFLYKDHTKRRLDKIFHQDLHKEHVDDKGANNLSNCIPSCQSCNSSKKQNEVISWYKGKSFYNAERMKKIQKWLLEDHKKFL